MTIKIGHSILTPYDDKRKVCLNMNLSYSLREAGVVGNEIEDNYDMEQIMIDAGLVTAKQCDTESCALYIDCDSREEAERIVKILNTFANSLVAEDRKKYLARKLKETVDAWPFAHTRTNA